MKNTNLHLLAQYVTKPRDPTQTGVAGYMTDPANIVYDEMVEITRGLKDADRMRCNVVLDLTAKQVIKNRFNTDATFDEMVKYYCESYPSYLAELGFTMEEVNVPTAVEAVCAQEITA